MVQWAWTWFWANPFFFLYHLCSYNILHNNLWLAPISKRKKWNFLILVGHQSNDKLMWVFSSPCHVMFRTRYDTKDTAPTIHTTITTTTRCCNQNKFHKETCFLKDIAFLSHRLSNILIACGHPDLSLAGLERWWPWTTDWIPAKSFLILHLVMTFLHIREISATLKMMMMTKMMPWDMVSRPDQ